MQRPCFDGCRLHELELGKVLPGGDDKGCACLQSGADIKVRDKSGETPLHHAAEGSKNLAVLMALLNAGANPKARDKDGKTPWGYDKDNKALKESDAYRRLNDARF